LTRPAEGETAKSDAMFRTGVREGRGPKIQHAEARTIEIKA
jgi:hypothetical protein